MGNIYAIAEMNARAEQLVMRIRGELFRIGCPPERFNVERCGPHVRMCYRNQLIESDPQDVLVALKGLPTGAEDNRIWQRMTRRGIEQVQNSPRGRGWLLGGVVLFVLLLALFFLNSDFNL